MIRSSVLKWSQLLNHSVIYVICLYKKGYFLMKWKLQMLSPFTNAMTQNCLIIIVLYLFCLTYLRSLKKIMYNRLNAYLDKFKILFSYQFGFRNFHSTYMALMTLMDKITKCLENNEHVIGIFLDFSKAFDTVHHDILLQKLSVYGVRGNALLWFQIYLDNRKQFVSYNEAKSDIKTVKCGVPQGSTLGPLLFLLYINDLAYICSQSIPILFADDTNLFNHGKDLSSLQMSLNKELAEISKWLKVKKLSLNIKKPQYMIFARKKSDHPYMDLRIDNENICQTKLSKFLEVYIDCKLNWKTHIKYVSRKIARGVGILVKARKMFNDECLKKLYHAFVYPYLNHCNHIWGNAYKTSLSNLQILQNRSSRIITGSPPRTCNDLFYISSMVCWISKILMYFWWGSLCTMSIMAWSLLYLRDFFVNNHDIHKHNTQISNHLILPPVHSNLSKSSIRYQGVIIWNKILKADTNLDASELSFKIMLTRGIQQEVITT